MPKLIVAVCLLAQSVSGETPATHEPIKWILTLVGATIFAAGAVALDNIIKRMRDKRGHNLPQLINEIFAEHQIAYPTFFVALLIGAQFKSDKYWAKDVVGILTFLAFLFYAISVYFTTLHEDAIHQDHMKHPCPGADCTRRLTTSTLLKMMLPTIVRVRCLLFVCHNVNALTLELKRALPASTASLERRKACMQSRSARCRAAQLLRPK
jgi:hypothetical protein